MKRFLLCFLIPPFIMVSLTLITRLFGDSDLKKTNSISNSCLDDQDYDHSVYAFCTKSDKNGTIIPILFDCTSGTLIKKSSDIRAFHYNSCYISYESDLKIQKALLNKSSVWLDSYVNNGVLYIK